MLKSDGKNIYSIFIAKNEFVFNFKNLKGSATADAKFYARVINGNVDYTAIHLADGISDINGGYEDKGTIDNGTKFTFEITDFGKITDEIDKKYFGLWAVEIYVHKSDGFVLQGWIPWDALQKMPNFTITKGG